ncbi:DNA sulfur modification protein DndB [Streptomyces sp. NPDC056347]|uniref:DNA sulfur modification protein DndB n=1 Tax=Streptomyces sp. NPDC056347 TaxID=3345790 RepID=UPI0035DD5ECA
MLSPVRTGLALKVQVVHPHLAIGVIDWENAWGIVNDPEIVEASANSKTNMGMDEYAEMRSAVQRLIGSKGSSKAKNIGPYADYLAKALKGELGNAWSTPPLTLWCQRPLIIDENGNTHLPILDAIVAVDAETQITAMHRIRKNKKFYGLDGFDFSTAMVAFEIYHGIPASDARQIFHDRNLKGVPVDKSLALSMDNRDLATTITRQLVDATTVMLPDGEKPLDDFIVTGKRQAGSSPNEWITLSALRTMVVTTLLGRSGIQASSGNASITLADLPDGVTESQALHEVVDALRELITTHTDQFVQKNAITTPAVLAGLGAAMHRTMSWTEEPFEPHVDVKGLLKIVRWERDAQYWGGVSATVKTDGKVTWGGGAKDSGYKVYTALTDPSSDVGKKIRGLA